MFDAIGLTLNLLCSLLMAHKGRWRMKKVLVYITPLRCFGNLIL